MTQGASESDNKMEFETILNNELGQFGKYQFINILLLAIPAAASGFMAGDYVFTAGRLPYRCAVPLCDEQVPEYTPNWILNAIPETSTGFEDCFRYAHILNTTTFPNNTCPAELFDRNTIIPCEGYVYGRTNTVVYDFGLECQEWLRALAGTLNSLGAMIALPLAGFVSDYFGRRISIVFFAFNVALVGLVKAFSVNYTMYVILQFLHTAIGGGLYSAAYILATELVGSKFRVATSATMSSMFACGQALLGGIAAAIPEWRKLTLTLFIPVFSLLSYYWIVTESHRWLLSKHRNDEAKRVLEKAARLNRKKISDTAMNIILTSIPRLSSEKTAADINNKPLFIRVINSPVMLRRCCTTPVYWIATTFIYYGLSINSVSLSELYPTRHRHSFLGFSSMLGRIGSVVAPLTPPLMAYWSGIPSILFATMAALAGLLVLTQPETRGLKVPDTFEEAEQLGRIHI
ncbi:unnamed protein product [Euphydryas editha]|uniref:Organic cation transporter n=1 Tax=Euphydryas editha TaxID=104508 RepID=A0AAU9U1R2_EUPED|nr:unnamed protein product [Euphydryas editha]